MDNYNENRKVIIEKIATVCNFAVNKISGELSDCFDLNCDDCLFNNVEAGKCYAEDKVEWLNSETKNKKGGRPVLWDAWTEKDIGFKIYKSIENGDVHWQIYGRYQKNADMPRFYTEAWGGTVNRTYAEEHIFPQRSLFADDYKKSARKTKKTENVLDDKEKAFLKGLRPLLIVGIIKHARPNKGTEFLELRCVNNWDIDYDTNPEVIVSTKLPDFLVGSMYKGMKLENEYFTDEIGVR